MRTRIAAALAVWTLACPLASQQRRASAQRMEIDVERQSESGWKVVNPKTVFEQGDRIRFRFHSSFNGYLYVMNYGTSGGYTVLFPRQDTGRENRVAAGAGYVIPATDGVFRISGPPGHDVVYWLVSPVRLDRPGAESLVSPPRPATLLPRCDDTILRARGECIDHGAGPSAGNDQRSRDLLFIEKEKRTVVAAPAPLEGPVVYEFRIAHR